MFKCNLGKGIKGILVVDTEGRIVEKVKLSKDTAPENQYPILTAAAFRHLGVTETEPFDILKVVIDKGEIIQVHVVTGITPVLKPSVTPSIEFTCVTNENSPVNILNMWAEYLKPGPRNET